MTRQCLKSASFTTTAMVVKTPFKSVFAIFHSLSRLIQFAYFVKCWRTLLKLKLCSDPLQQRNVKKSIKRVRRMGKFRNCFWLLQSYSHHLVRCYPLSSIPSVVCIGLSDWKEGLCDLFLSCEGNKSHNPSLQADKRLVFTSARIRQGTGVPNDGFLLTTLNTLFRLFRVLLDL